VDCALKYVVIPFFHMLCINNPAIQCYTTCKKYLFLVPHILLYCFFNVIHQARKQVSSQACDIYLGGTWFKSGS
jgi:hypothetical protein